MAGASIDDLAIWLVWSNEHQRWWKPNWRGYTSIIGEAGRYPKRVADQIVRDANYGPMINEVAVLAPEAFESIATVDILVELAKSVLGK